MLFYFNFFQIGVYFIFACFLGSVILLSSYMLSIDNPDVEKLSAYECGFNPYEDAHNVFDVRFYIVAILFIVFDLEAAFFFPWCGSFSFLDLSALYGMLDFICELFIGFIYAWLIGALDWS